MFVFTANGAEPTMSCVAKVMLLSLIVRRNVVGQKKMNIKACVPIRRKDGN